MQDTVKRKETEAGSSSETERGRKELAMGTTPSRAILPALQVISSTDRFF